MADGLEGLRRDFLIDELREVTSGAGVTGTIVVESARSNEETEWLQSALVIRKFALLMRFGRLGWQAVFSPTLDTVSTFCAGTGPERSSNATVRMYYGPSLWQACEWARSRCME